MENIIWTTVDAAQAEEAAGGWLEDADGQPLARIVATTPAGVDIGQLTDATARGLLYQLQAHGVLSAAEYARWDAELAR